MSWITELAGKAETLLNKLDTETATALSSHQKSFASFKSDVEVKKADLIREHFAIVGVKNIESWNKSSRKSSSLNASPRRKVEKGNAISTMNSSYSDSNVLSEENVKSFDSTHSRQSSVSSSSSYSALADRHMPGFVSVGEDENGSSETGSRESAHTDPYLTVETPVDLPISAPSSTHSSSSSASSNMVILPSDGGYLVSSTDSETELLRKEVASLNQEMTQVLRRAKQAETEARQLKAQRSNLSFQQSASDKLLRELQQQENDIKETLKAKDGSLAILRVRLHESEELLKEKEKINKDIMQENHRLIEGANVNSGIQSQALQTLQDKLSEVQSIHDNERACNNSSQEELRKRIHNLEEEHSKLGLALTESQKKLDDEKSKMKDLHSQISSLKAELSSSQNELTEYKARATRILQSKDKLISSLKDGKQEGENANDSFVKAEVEQLRSERNLLQDELEASSQKLKHALAEISTLEGTLHEETQVASQNVFALEADLSSECTKRQQTEDEARHLREELKCVREDITRQKLTFSARIEEREGEIQRLQKQIAHKHSSSTSHQDLENRIHSLTESLIMKQTSIEILSTEKHSLLLQMEKLKQQYNEAQNMLNRDALPSLPQDEGHNRVPSFFIESPFDGQVTRKVKRVYSTVDKFSVRLGIFLRRYPVARVFIIIYMFLLHFWVLIVLLTYTPEIHGPDYSDLSKILNPPET